MRALAHKLIARAGRSYAAGETLDDAKRLAATLVEKGYGLTLGYWNLDDDDPNVVTEQYREAIAYLTGLPNDGYLSIKPPAFAFDKDVYGRLVDSAAELNVALHLDSHAHETADATIALLALGRTSGTSRLGCSLPGRWQRSLQDADLLARLEVVPRVVKGQWGDPLHPNIDPRQGFIAVVRRLAGNVPLVRIATHDPVLVRECAQTLQKAKTACELELLHGLPAKKTIQVARDHDLPVRVYIPYGYAWIPYALNNLTHNPKALWWFLKDALLGPYSKTFPPRTVRA